MGVAVMGIADVGMAVLNGRMLMGMGMPKGLSWVLASQLVGAVAVVVVGVYVIRTVLMAMVVMLGSVPMPVAVFLADQQHNSKGCLLYTSPSPRDV